MTVGETARIREVFDRQAANLAEDTLALEASRARRLVHFANIPHGARVLDVGCGAGSALAHIVRQGAWAVGVDLSSAMLARASGTRAAAIQAAAERLPFRDAAFDMVLCRETLHHVPAPDAAVWEMRRVLRPGGAVVLEDVLTHVQPAIAAQHNDLERLRDPAHERFLSVSSLAGLVEEAGFEIEAVEVVEHERELEEWLAGAEAPASMRPQIRRRFEDDLKEPRLGLRTRRADGRVFFDLRHAMVKGAKR
jgi:SAM-dependent methyltransferase